MIVQPDERRSFECYHRSERALVAKLVHMYVQAVSTRKVNVITEKLCGHAFLTLVDLGHQQATGRELEGICLLNDRLRRYCLPHPGCPATRRSAKPV